MTGAANGRIPRSGEAGVVAGPAVVPVVAVGVECVVAAGVCSGATVTAGVSPGYSPTTEAPFFCVKTAKYENPGERNGNGPHYPPRGSAEGRRGALILKDQHERVKSKKRTCGLAPQRSNRHTVSRSGRTVTSSRVCDVPPKSTFRS